MGFGLGLLLLATAAQGQVGTWFYDGWATSQIGGGPDSAWR